MSDERDGHAFAVSCADGTSSAWPDYEPLLSSSDPCQPKGWGWWRSNHCDAGTRPAATDTANNSYTGQARTLGLSWAGLESGFPIGSSSVVEEPEDDTQVSCCSELTWVERIYGFFVCFIAGGVISFMSLGSLSQALLGRPSKFAVAYSVGNILSLCATAFLVGPARQWRGMMEPKRFRASLIYVGSVIMTFMSVCYFAMPLLIIIFVIVQWAALAWYSLSYIPYGPSLVTRAISAVFPFV